MKLEVARVVLTKHAREQMKHRSIALEDVQRVALDPETRYEDRSNGSLVCTGRVRSGRLLSVCLVNPPQDGRGLVKTAYYRDDEEV